MAYAKALKICVTCGRSFLGMPIHNNCSRECGRVATARALRKTPSGDTQKCTQCGQVQPLTNFYQRLSRRATDCFFSECISCTRTRHQLANLRPNAKESARRTGRATRLRRAEWYFGLKDMKPCSDCGVAYPWYVMQWDHLGDKEDHVSALYRKKATKERILAEIAKCELVCANCHFTRTYQRQVAEAQGGVESIAS